MNTLDCIKTRRSKRQFLDKKVPKEIIDQILECAITAPSSVNSQPWEFVLVEDKGLKQKIAIMKDENNRQQFITASVLIVVCVDLEKSPSRYLDDGVTATQNILLAAHDLGLGSVYMCGWKPDKPEIANEVRKILDIPEKIQPITILPIGYPDPNEEIEDKELIQLEKIIHYNKW